MINKKLLEAKIKPHKLLLTPLFPLIVFWYWLMFILTPKIMRPGLHVIAGDTGSGKTLLASRISRLWANKGFRVYSNSQFNSVIRKIDILEHYNDFEIKKPMMPGVWFYDEIIREFNKRLNRSNKYNEVFIPLVEDLVTHRHNGVVAVYFITQSWDLLDTQLQSLLQQIHFVFSRKKPIYKAWLRDSKIKPQVAPKWVKYVSKKRKDINKDDFDKYVNRKHELKYVKPKINKMPIPLKEFIDFNTFAFKRQMTEKEKEKE